MAWVRVPQKLFSRDTIVFGYFLINLLCWAAFFLVSTNIYSNSTKHKCRPPTHHNIPSDHSKALNADFWQVLSPEPDSDGIRFVQSHLISPAISQLEDEDPPVLDVETGRFIQRFFPRHRNGTYLKIGSGRILGLEYLEQQQNWTGLTIGFDLNDSKRFNSASLLLQACLHTGRGVINIEGRYCVSISAVTDALEVSTVDFLLIEDGNGVIPLLMSIPWNRLSIGLIQVRCCREENGSVRKDKYYFLLHFLSNLDYEIVSKLKQHYIFQKKPFKTLPGATTIARNNQ